MHLSRRPIRLFTLALCLTLLSSCSDPIVMIPGKVLSGKELLPPQIWENIPDTIQVETNLADSYSINIWGVGIAEDLYIATGEDGTKWSDFIDQSPNVRVRIDKDIYQLTAALITEKVEREKVTAAYITKYDVDKDDNWLRTGLIFRLDRLN
jgi:hypothetical protein